MPRASDRLDRMLALLEAEIPGARVIHKADSPLMRTLGLVLTPLVPDFQDRFATAFFRTVYLPVPVARVTDRDALAVTIGHELVHLVDERDHGPVFHATYLLTPAPFGRTHRAHWERRGYAVDLMLAFERGGLARLDHELRRVAAVFAGPAYGWMWAGLDAARAYLQPTADAVREGTLQRSAPYDDILAAWRG